MARLHLFDLDGTLLRATSAPVEISRQPGVETETVAIDREISAGVIGPPEYAARVHALWAGLTETHVAAAFAGAPCWPVFATSGRRSVGREPTAPSCRG